MNEAFEALESGLDFLQVLHLLHEFRVALDHFPQVELLRGLVLQVVSEASPAVLLWLLLNIYVPQNALPRLDVELVVSVTHFTVLLVHRDLTPSEITFFVHWKTLLGLPVLNESLLALVAKHVVFVRATGLAVLESIPCNFVLFIEGMALVFDHLLREVNGDEFPLSVESADLAGIERNGLHFRVEALFEGRQLLASIVEPFEPEHTSVTHEGAVVDLDVPLTFVSLLMDATALVVERRAEENSSEEAVLLASLSAGQEQEKTDGFHLNITLN